MVSDVSPSYPAGGGERMLWEQARRLAARGHDVRVVSRADSDAAGPVALEREGVRIRQFPLDRRSVARFIRSSILGARRATADELARQTADVLHLHHPSPAMERSPPGPAVDCRASTASIRRRRSSTGRAA